MKQKQIKHIIFDWSGVIADTFDSWYFSSNKVLEHFGHKKLSRKEAHENFTQPYMLFYNKYLPNLSIEDQHAVYKKAITTLPIPKIFPGIRKEIMKLKKSGLELSILSGDAQETLFPEMKKYKLEKIFNQIEFNIHDKTKVIKRVIKKSKHGPLETIFIGDTIHETEAGKKANCQTLSVTWGFMTKERLLKMKPTYIINKPDQLSNTLLNNITTK